MVFYHALHANGERNGDYGGQCLRYDGHGERNAEDQHLDERLTAHQAERNDNPDDDKCCPCQQPTDAVELLSTKLGLVLVVLGVLHLLNVLVLNRTRRHRQHELLQRPPLPPTGMIAPPPLPPLPQQRPEQEPAR